MTTAEIPLRRRMAWLTMTVLAIGIVGYAARYLALDPEVYFEQQRATYQTNEFAIIAHIAGGSVALAVGPFQFLSRLRSRRPTVHRVVGRLYLGGVLVGSAAGLYMAFLAHGGAISSAGFGTLAVFWFATGLQALRTIRTGDVEDHRRWMIRNFALTFAAVTLRLWLVPLAATFGFDTGYRIVSWVCWIPNLAVAEAMLRRGGPTSAPASRAATALPLGTS
jgi:uncharacterized membrane protein